MILKSQAHPSGRPCFIVSHLRTRPRLGSIAEQPGEDAMSEDTERGWFRKVATVLMLAGFCVGMTPFVNKWISPSSQTRR
jgi:hypothetical protein